MNLIILFISFNLSTRQLLGLFHCVIEDVMCVCVSVTLNVWLADGKVSRVLTCFFFFGFLLFV